RDAGVGAGDDEVGIGGLLLGEALAGAVPGFVNAPSEDERIGPGEVDVLEDAARGLGLREGEEAAHAVLVDDDELAGLDLAHVLGVEDVVGAGFAREDVGVLQAPQDKRAEA